MKGNCATGKVVGIIRIVLGIAMLAFGVMKFGAPAEAQAMIGGAGHALGLTFLSVTAWYWIAMIGEIVAGLLLLTGCKKLAKLGAILTLIIMVFAINAVGMDPKAIAFAIAALAVLIWGPGCFAVCKGKCCTGGACCTKDGTCDTTKSCDMDGGCSCSKCGDGPCMCGMQQEQQQQENQEQEENQQQHQQ